MTIVVTDEQIAARIARTAEEDGFKDLAPLTDGEIIMDIASKDAEDLENVIRALGFDVDQFMTYITQRGSDAGVGFLSGAIVARRLADVEVFPVNVEVAS